MKNSDRRLMSWREALEYCDGIPGLVLTLVVLAALVAGFWALYIIWDIGEVIGKSW